MSVYGTPAVKIVLNTTDPSGSFILNQYAGPQTGNFWVTGKGRVDSKLGIGGVDPTYALHVNTTDPIAASFSGRVIGADAVNNNEFITKAQMDATVGTPPVLLATQVGYGSTGNTLTGSGGITFAVGTGKLTLNTALGRLIQLGSPVATATPNPVQIHMGASYSDTAGSNLKLVVFDNNIGGIAGLGFAASSMEYVVPASTSHKFYSGAFPLMSMSTLMIGVHQSLKIVWDDNIAPKMVFYGGQPGGPATLNLGVDTGGVLYTNVPTGGKHALRINGVDAFTISGVGAAITTVSQDDAKTNILTWDATDKLVRWRAASSIVNGLTAITADNGLTATTVSNVQLGAASAGVASPLLHNTYINTGAFRLEVNTNTVDILAGGLTTVNTGGGTALLVSAYGGANAHANAHAVRIDNLFTSTNTVESILQILRSTGAGGGANGVGGSIDFRAAFGVTGGNNPSTTTNRLISKWTTAGSVSQFIITGVNGSMADLFTLNGVGSLQLNKYGIGTFPGTAAFNLAVDSTGKLIEVSAAAAPPLAHALLGVSHSDTVGGAPVLGAMIVGNGTPAWDRLLGHTVAAKRFLTQTGTGVNSAIPIWGSIAAGDIPDLSATYVPVTRTLTINGSAQDLSANRIWTIAITGTVNRITVTNGSTLTPIIDIAATYVGQASITTVGTITTGVWNGTTIATGFGGTGLTSYVLGDILYASAANVLAALPGNTVAARRFLRQTGTGVVSAAPVWDTITTADVVGIDTTYVPLTRQLTINGSAQTLAADRTWTITTTGTANRITVTGGAGLTPTIDIAATYAGQASIVTVGTITTGTWNGSVIGPTFGGTGISTYTIGDTLYASATNVLSKLPGNITTGKMFLSQTGSGSVSAAPVWSAMAGSDITGAALTEVDDTNVTVTLGGTPATALLRAVSITMGWAGVLAVTRGGTGLAAIAQGDLIYGSAANTFSILNKNATATRYLSNTGTNNNPAWSQVDLSNGVTGTLPLAGIGNGVARSVLGVTGNAAATRADIQSTAADQVFVTNGAGTAIVWGTVATGGITNSAVTYAKIQNVTATSRFLGRITAGAGIVEELTGTQATSLLDLFSTTTTTKGVVPGSNNAGSTMFLRADGIWAVPPGGGGGGYTTLSQFVDETAWRIFYSNAAGDVTPLAFGTSGQVLQSTGATSAPIWATASGSGTIGGTIAATQVGYGSGVNTLTSSADFIFVSGKVTLNKTTGTNLQLGVTTSAQVADPVRLNMGASYSNAGGANPKLILYDDGAGVISGFGISSSQLDYIAFGGSVHSFYVGASKNFIVGPNVGSYVDVDITANKKLSFITSAGEKINFYQGGGGGSDFTMGIASATLYYNVGTGSRHSFRTNGIEAFSVTPSGATTLTTAQNVTDPIAVIIQYSGQVGNSIEVRHASAGVVFSVDTYGSVTTNGSIYSAYLGVDKPSHTYPGLWLRGNVASATTYNYVLLQSADDFLSLNGPNSTGKVMFTVNNDGTDVMLLNSNRNLGIGFAYNAEASITRKLYVNSGSAGADIKPIARFNGYDSVSAAGIGLGAALELSLYIGTPGNTVGTTLASVLIGTGGGGSFDFVVFNTWAGVATEALRSLYSGELAVRTLVQDDAQTKVAVWDSTSKLFKWRAASTFGSGTIGGSLAATQVAFGSAANTITGVPEFTYTATGLAVQGSTGIAVAGTNAYNAGASSNIVFYHKYNTAGGMTEGGRIMLLKENAIDGEYGTRYVVYSRIMGAGLTGALEIDGKQRLLLGYYVGNPAVPYNLAVGSTATNHGGLLVGVLTGQTSDAVQIQDGAGNPIFKVGPTANTYIAGTLEVIGNGIFKGGLESWKVSDTNFRAGKNALASITTGEYNVAIGWNAGAAMTDAGSNIILGAQSGGGVTGSENTALGGSAMYCGSGMTGRLNVAIGRAAMYSASGNASDNIAVGYYALNGVSGGGNIAMGTYTLYGMTTGGGNIAIGGSAGAGLTTSSLNILIGVSAGQAVTVGANNVMIGSYSGQYATGTGNTYLGTNAGNNTQGDNNVFIGNGAQVSGAVSNQFVINNGSVTPLITGDFFTRVLNVNGQLNVTSTTGTIGIFTSSYYLGGFLYIDGRLVIRNSSTTGSHPAFESDGGGGLVIYNNPGAYGNFHLNTSGWLHLGYENYGYTNPESPLHIYEFTGAGGSLVPLIRLEHAHYTPNALNMGVGILYKQSTFLAGYTGVIWGDTTAAAERFDFVVQLMNGGAVAAEKMRIKGTGEMALQLLVQDNALANVVVWDPTTKLFKYRAAGTIGGGAGGGYTTLVQFVDETAWQMFYSNGSGDVTNLALGTTNQVLTSTGISSAPIWTTPTVAASTKFGVAGQDNTAAEERAYTMTNNSFEFKLGTSGAAGGLLMGKSSVNNYAEISATIYDTGSSITAQVAVNRESTTGAMQVNIGIASTATQNASFTFTPGLALLQLGSASSFKISGLGTAAGDKTLRYDTATGIVTYHDIPTGGGGGVSSFAFTNANGFSGSVATSTTTPTLTLTTSLTTGSVPFIGAAGALLQDNALFFWDNTNKRLGIGNNAPGYRLQVNGSAYVLNNFAHNTQGGWGAFLNNTSQIPAGSTFTAGYTWAGGASSNTMQFAGSSTVNQGAIIAGHTVSNRVEFTNAGATITLTQAAGIRVLAGLQILSQIVGTIGGTVTHGASLMIQGVYPTSTGVVQFNNYYGILINPLDEWLIVTFTNRWAIYQQGPNDPSYFASRIQIGNVSNQSTTNLLEVTGGFYVNVSTATMQFVGLATDNTATQVLAKNASNNNVWRDISSISGGAGGGENLDATMAIGSNLTTSRSIGVGANELEVTGSGSISLQGINTGTGVAIQGLANGTGISMDASKATVNTTDIIPIMHVSLTTTDTPIAGIGSFIRFFNPSGIATSNQAGWIAVRRTVISTSVPQDDFEFWTQNAGTMAKSLVLKSTGHLLLGNLTSTTSATPISISLGGTYSSTVNTAPKLALYDNGSVQYGIGVAASVMFYTVPAAVAHRFYVGTVSALMLGVGGGIGNYMQSPTLTDVTLQLFIDPSNTANAFEIKTGLVIVHSVSTAGNGYYAGNLTVANTKSFIGRLAPRVGTVASSSSLTIDSDANDMYTVTALAANLAMQNPSGTPVNGQKLMIRIKDNVTARGITWPGTQWRAGDIALPLTTIANRSMYLGFIWNSTDSKWDFIAYNDNFI